MKFITEFLNHFQINYYQNAVHFMKKKIINVANKLATLFL